MNRAYERGVMILVVVLVCGSHLCPLRASDAELSLLDVRSDGGGTASVAIVETLTDRRITGYSQEDGWDRERAARRWRFDGHVSSFDEALAQQRAGVPFERIDPVLVAQSMRNPPYRYGTKVIIEITEGRFAGVKLPGIILDCGAFGPHAYDIYTTHTATAFALTSNRATIHILP